MKSQYIVMMLVLVFSVFSVNAALYQVNSTSDQSSIRDAGSDILNPQFSVQVLKYEPYPVNPGDWFDLWIDLKNVAQNDAPDLRFEFNPVYPFSTNDTLVRDYGRISGTYNAFNYKQPEEQIGNANQIVVKYRLKVADNAPEGTNFVKFTIMPDKNNPRTAYNYNLPIIVGKTRTDFDVIMQDSSAQGTSLSILNTGQNPATAMLVTLHDEAGLKITGPRSSVIGNLDKGDFTTVTFQITASKDVTNVTADISYTDISGVRNTVTKVVPVNIAATAAGTGARAATTSTSSRWLYLIAGLLMGFFVEYTIHKYEKRKQK